MDIKGWKYYNHAMIPLCAPHEEPDTSPINDKSIWKDAGKPIMARWTTDFDCGYETDWWFIIKDAPFNPEELSPKTRKHIRQALGKVYVKKCDPKKYSKDIYRVYTEAFGRYKNTSSDALSYESFISGTYIMDNASYWCAFEITTDRMVGYMKCIEYDTYIEIAVSKFSSDCMNLRASDALHQTVLDYYLNTIGKKYVNSGTRNVNHETQVQEYKIDTFGFRRAYCKLNVAYRPGLKWIINVLYIFRRPLRHIDKGVFHLINSLLSMEEMARNCKKDEKKAQ